MVEHEVAKQNHVYDFQDFVEAVSRAGTTIDDFRNWEKQLSEGKESKSKTRIVCSLNGR